MGADSDCHRFLSDVSVTRSVDQTALVTARELLLRLPDELHRAVEIQRRCFLGNGHPFFPIVAPALAARLPPSIGISVPVSQLDASEARNTARPLMSSGCPSRPVGMPSRNLSRSLGSAAMR